MAIDDRAEAGDELRRHQAFRSAMAPLMNVAYRVLRRLGVRHREIDDAMQTVLVIADRKFDELPDPQDLKTYLCAACVNVARDVGRHRARQAARSGVLEDLDEAPGAVPDPEDALGRKQALELLQRVLETMDEERREVFVLYELEELTGPEIAEHLGVPVGTVASRLRKAREEFRAAIARAHVSDRFRRGGR